MYTGHFPRTGTLRARDVLAGALLVNAIPHTIMGLAGKRCMTPLGGTNSSPAANLLWAGLNLLSGVAALEPRTWRASDQPGADERLRAVTLGTIAMAALAAIYELSPTAARRRRVRAVLAPSQRAGSRGDRSPALGSSRLA
ncbi:MAG: hypothetical protein WAU75_04615 [Solirubrobacteraceae bacterium]